MSDGFKWQTEVEVVIRNLDGVVTERHTNQIQNPGLNYMAKSLISSTFDMKIRYMGYGPSSSTGDVVCKVLGGAASSGESGRKAITSATSSATGRVFTVCYLAPSEANEKIGELGWFAGSSATATLDSGTLVGRSIGLNRTKTNIESITITRTDILSTG